jgi:hypothetical protein
LADSTRKAGDTSCESASGKGRQQMQKQDGQIATNFGIRHAQAARPSRGIAGLPVVSAFLRSTESSPNNYWLNEFYRQRDELETAVNSYRAFQKAGEKTKAERIARENPQADVKLRRFNGYGESLRDLGQSVNAVIKNREWSSDEKHRKLVGIYRDMESVARTALGRLPISNRERPAAAGAKGCATGNIGNEAVVMTLRTCRNRATQIERRCRTYTSSGWRSQMPARSIWPLLLLAVLEPPLTLSAQQAPCGTLYNIGHMTNKPDSVTLAISKGANAVEVDLSFRSDGTYTTFTHGPPCSCDFLNLGDSLCDTFECSDSASVEDMITHLASNQAVALVVIDSKVNTIDLSRLGHAGTSVAQGIVRELDRRGYTGNIILSVPSASQSAYLQSAVEDLRKNAPTLLSRFRVSIDQEANDADRVIDTLNPFAAGLIAYGTGSTIFPSTYGRGIRRARERQIAFSYVWTVNLESTIQMYLDQGVRGLMTEYPQRVTKLIAKGSWVLARRGDAFDCPAPSAPRPPQRVRIIR